MFFLVGRRFDFASVFLPFLLLLDLDAFQPSKPMKKQVNNALSPASYPGIVSLVDMPVNLAVPKNPNS